MGKKALARWQSLPHSIYSHVRTHAKKKKKGAELKGAMPLSNQQKFCFTLQSLYVGPSKDLSPDHQYISIKHG